MNEQQVTKIMEAKFEREFPAGYDVNVGEYTVDALKYRADIVVTKGPMMNGGNEVLALECKGKKDINKGIGQALCLTLSNCATGLAAYKIPSELWDIVEDLPIYCFSITENGVQTITKPDEGVIDDITSIDVPTRVKDM